MKKHNGVISFWKFIFCMIIVIFHAGACFASSDNILFRMGSIGVEFFFLVSGYLMASSIVSKKSSDSVGKETFTFLLKKFKAFFPYIFIAFAIDVILRTILGNMTFETYVLSIWDLFLLLMPGFKTGGLIRHTWYISAMLCCMALLYPQIRKFKENYFYLIAPLSVIFIAGWLNQNYSHLRGPFIWINFTHKGMVRAYFELCLGTILYPISLKISKINFTKIGRWLLTIIEISGYLITVLASQFIYGGKMDFVLLLLLAISVTLSFSNRVVEKDLFNNKYFYFLEKLSLPLYLVHVPIRNYLDNMNLTYYQSLIILVSVSILVSHLMIVLVDFLKKREFFIPKLKKLLVEQ